MCAAMMVRDEMKAKHDYKVGPSLMPAKRRLGLYFPWMESRYIRAPLLIYFLATYHIMKSLIVF